ncbi:MAG: hypothetical protein KDA28_12135, partial [Phycisphaerales bacterium]|nr:hypothetical protein [Phycisphaerales bacterium]
FDHGRPPAAQRVDPCSNTQCFTELVEAGLSADPDSNGFRFLDTALVHFDTFDTFRGADAAWVFARALFGVGAFAIEPYHLGLGNDEAIDSGVGETDTGSMAEP